MAIAQAQIVHSMTDRTTTARMAIVPVVTVRMAIVPVATARMGIVPVATVRMGIVPVATAHMGIVPVATARLETDHTRRAQVLAAKGVPAAKADLHVPIRLVTDREAHPARLATVLIRRAQVPAVPVVQATVPMGIVLPLVVPEKALTRIVLSVRPLAPVLPDRQEEATSQHQSKRKRLSAVSVAPCPRSIVSAKPKKAPRLNRPVRLPPRQVAPASSVPQPILLVRRAVSMKIGRASCRERV